MYPIQQPFMYEYDKLWLGTSYSNPAAWLHVEKLIGLGFSRAAIPCICAFVHGAVGIRLWAVTSGYLESTIFSDSVYLLRPQPIPQFMDSGFTNSTMAADAHGSFRSGGLELGLRRSPGLQTEHNASQCIATQRSSRCIRVALDMWNGHASISICMSVLYLYIHMRI